MQYVVLVFDETPKHPTTGETPMEAFVRRFENYRGLRTQIGAVRVAIADMTAEERVQLDPPNLGDKPDEPA